jgi:hypothetical protein
LELDLRRVLFVKKKSENLTKSWKIKIREIREILEKKIWEKFPEISKKNSSKYSASISS